MQATQFACESQSSVPACIPENPSRSDCISGTASRLISFSGIHTHIQGSQLVLQANPCTLDSPRDELQLDSTASNFVPRWVFFCDGSGGSRNFGGEENPGFQLPRQIRFRSTENSEDSDQPKRKEQVLGLSENSEAQEPEMFYPDENPAQSPAEDGDGSQDWEDDDFNYDAGETYEEPQAHETLEERVAFMEQGFWAEFCDVHEKMDLLRTEIQQGSFAGHEIQRVQDTAALAKADIHAELQAAYARLDREKEIFAAEIGLKIAEQFEKKNVELEILVQQNLDLRGILPQAQMRVEMQNLQTEMVGLVTDQVKGFLLANPGSLVGEGLTRWLVECAREVYDKHAQALKESVSTLCVAHDTVRAQLGDMQAKFTVVDQSLHVLEVQFGNLEVRANHQQIVHEHWTQGVSKNFSVIAQQFAENARENAVLRSENIVLKGQISTLAGTVENLLTQVQALTRRVEDNSKLLEVQRHPVQERPGVPVVPVAPVVPHNVTVDVGTSMPVRGESVANPPPVQENASQMQSFKPSRTLRLKPLGSGQADIPACLLEMHSVGGGRVASGENTGFGGYRVAPVAAVEPNPQNLAAPLMFGANWVQMQLAKNLHHPKFEETKGQWRDFVWEWEQFWNSTPGADKCTDLEKLLMFAVCFSADLRQELQ